MKNLLMNFKKSKKIEFNESLALLNDYPFQRLNNLLKNIKNPSSENAIILSIGEPNHKPPNFIRQIIDKNFPKWQQYPPSTGMQKLNVACLKWLNRRFNLSTNLLDPQKNIIQLAGTREGLFNVALALNPKLKNKSKPIILIPDPFYQVYVGAARISGAKPVFVEALKKNRFIPNFHSLNKNTLKKTSIIYICSPSNPEGSALNLEEWHKLIILIKKYNIILIVDECYTDIYYDTPPIGVLEACLKLKTNFDNIISFHSLSKRSNVPGLRSGFAVGDKNIIKNYKKLRHYCAGQQPIPLQEAAIALWNDDLHASSNRSKYKNKFDIAKKIFGKKFNFYIPDGGFYLWLNVGNGEKIAKLLWKEKSIKVMPGCYLSNSKSSKKFIRIALVLNIKETEVALKKIYYLLNKKTKK
tara:strand:+ start:76 stop:1311 length:1236 start_codon:yes stop_codon:yes gene_type:complete